jgi:hypothetical protein
MNRYSLVFSLCVMSYLCMAGVSQAQVTLELVSPGSNIANNVYVGPYTLSVNGAGTIQAVCDDRDTETGNSTWTAYVNTFATLSNTKFFNAPSINAYNQTQNYESAAWLVQQMMAIPNIKANYTEIADMHLAIWSFFSASSFSSLSSDSDALSWYNKAVAQRNDPFSDFSDIIIYTPSPTSASQEFMGETPEPASMMLFGTGLLAIGGLVRRRRAQREPATKEA